MRLARANSFQPSDGLRRLYWRDPRTGSSKRGLAWPAAKCVVKRMRNLTSDAGCLPIAGDVATLHPSWAMPSLPAAEQGTTVPGLRSGDREAAEELFNACYPRLAGWGRRVVGDDGAAAEAAPVRST